MDWSEILKTIVWPVVALVASVLLRKPLMRLVNELASRTKKLSYKGVSFEFEPLPVMSPGWSVTAGSIGQDVRQLTSSEIFDSYSSTLFDQLLHPKNADYAIVDLGGGDQWLTSRLFIFSLVLGEVSGLRALVFLETTPLMRKRFLGVAAPRNVRKALARRYPWLEQAYAWAYAEQYGVIALDIVGQSKTSANLYILSSDLPGHISQMVRKYVTNIQRESSPPESEKDSYLCFQSTMPTTPAVPKTLWERGEWINGEKLERDLSDCLEYSWYVDSPEKSEIDKADSIRKRRGRFVALVDEDRRFLGLVDRHALLLKTAAEFREKRDLEITSDP